MLLVDVDWWDAINYTAILILIVPLVRASPPPCRLVSPYPCSRDRLGNTPVAHTFTT